MPALIFFCLLVLYSCSDPMDVEDNINKIPVYNDSLNQNGIKPLAHGNKWIYQITETDSNGVIINTYSITDSVLKDTVIDKARWYSTSQYPQYWQGNLNDGLRFREYPQGKPVYEWLEAKFPGAAGFTWQANSSQRSIVSVDTLIMVTAGSFNCYYYYDVGFNQTFGWEYSNMFFCPKTGLIKSEIYRERFDKTKYLFQKTELIAFIKKT